jgi:glycine betaine/choline ABC-type transport system substrate-binding protein
MLDIDFQYYIDNQIDLVKKYDGRYIVIVDEKVVGNYDDYSQALSDSLKNYEMGTFLVQKCSPGNNDYTLTFHSRVAFT